MSIPPLGTGLETYGKVLTELFADQPLDEDEGYEEDDGEKASNHRRDDQCRYGNGEPEDNEAHSHRWMSDHEGGGQTDDHAKQSDESNGPREPTGK